MNQLVVIATYPTDSIILSSFSQPQTEIALLGTKLSGPASLRDKPLFIRSEALSNRQLFFKTWEKIFYPPVGISNRFVAASSLFFQDLKENHLLTFSIVDEANNVVEGVKGTLSFFIRGKAK